MAIIRIMTPAESRMHHPYYHFHGFAGGQIAGDGKFFDRSGFNHGVRGNNLSDTQMFANSGYVSSVDPTSGLPDSVIRIPAINFDYVGGEKLIVWWLGKILSEGTGQLMMGDGYSTTVKGWGILASTTQKAQLVLYGDGSKGQTAGFSGSTAETVFDGNLHSFGMVIDGFAKKYAFWVDDAIDANFPNGYASFNNGVSHDTKSINTVNIGSASPAPGGTGGIATQTRALVILRLPSSYSTPSEPTITSVFQQLRADPGKLILAGSL